MISLLTQHRNIFIKIMKCFWYPLQKHAKMIVLFLHLGFDATNIVLVDVFMFTIL
ncbi:unnamed protein product [Acanthoscelides obtectus]|uniref:Uncharacterized protein n=1 Tax=Acanthoscelides obtectus TaxID=200917 RepID=A0A9P0L9P0_ACAOB|nr:unnamed protein product [Acanthoscelides obtectus]CAK1635626.1 hypothetical protein AOBTE_LOCUS9398 [Acanthoscelides obtectus]